MRPKYSQFPYTKRPGEPCVCDVTVFDNIAVAGSRLVISLAHGFKCASDLLASNANFRPVSYFKRFPSLSAILVCLSNTVTSKT